MSNKLDCILLVDDYQPSTYLNRLYIQDAECTNHLEITENGEKALEYLLANLSKPEKFPDLIFIDLDMPSMNGWELLGRISAMKNKPDKKLILIILTTSFDPVDQNRAATLSEVSDFITKPLTPEKLDQVLSKFFDFA